VKFSDVSAPAHNRATGPRWTGTLTPSLPPDIESITPGGSPRGYTELEDFHVDPEPGFGDETIANYTVPSFLYGGETYDTVGVDSNGYVVVGGGTSTDNECCTLTPFPNATRPNNVLAPFWTDLSLDPATGGGSVRIAILSNTVDQFLIVEWDKAKTFGTDGSGTPNSFQVWLTLGSDEGVYFAYGALGGAAGQPAEYGAENKDGSSGVNIAAPSSNADYTVNAGHPTPGGKVHFTYRASSSRAGIYRLLTSVTSPLVRGTTTAATTLTVNK
jgi:hypothetical protein